MRKYSIPTHWTHDVNWTYLKRSEDVQDYHTFSYYAYFAILSLPVEYIYISTDIKEVIYIRVAAPWGGGRDFNPSATFQIRVNFEKIYYKCTSFCSFVCFKLSFKVSGSLKLPIFPCGALFLFDIPKILVQLCEPKFLCDFNLFVGIYNAMAQYICIISLLIHKIHGWIWLKL